ncbi:bacterial extracellular solute-binding protein, family 3 [Ilyonectria sp. MPI-CAGE-AT-0026]|nr:bacterial extracellular solute-binding protein, family 3 [Ilyonectria sp. MPI-CAGE-AT-0026]
MVNFGLSASLFVNALGLVAAKGLGSFHGPSVPLAYANLTSKLDEVISRGYLTVGTTGDYKPFTYLVTDVTALPNSTAINTTYIGADIDAAQSLSNALGLPKPPRLVHTVWANITSDLTAGKFDIAMGGVSLTLSRARTAFFSTAIQRVGKTACIRCSDAAKFTDLDSIDQEGVRVAVNPGGTNEAFDRANLKVATIVTFQDNNAVFEAVRSSKADVMISDLIEVELQVRLHEGELCIVNPTAPFNFEELGYAIQRDPVWKHFVDTWVHIQLGSGAWNTTLEKWLSYKWPLV